MIFLRCAYLGTMPRLAVLLVCFLFLLPCLQSAAAFKFQVAPRTEECLYESARPGDLVNIKFQVLEGGNQDIDIKVPLRFVLRSSSSDGSLKYFSVFACRHVKITFKAKNSPNGVERLIMIGQRKKEEKYVFLADNEGEFKFCFSNLMSISTPKTINVATSVTIPRQTVQSGTPA